MRHFLHLVTEEAEALFTLRASDLGSRTPGCLDACPVVPGACSSPWLGPQSPERCPEPRHPVKNVLADCTNASAPLRDSPLSCLLGTGVLGSTVLHPLITLLLLVFRPLCGANPPLGRELSKVRTASPSFALSGTKLQVLEPEGPFPGRLSRDGGSWLFSFEDSDVAAHLAS